MPKTTKSPRKRGRPTLYSEALAAKICRRLAEGESLREVCRDSAMPAHSTVVGWVLDGEHAWFSDQYARARYLQADKLLDEALEIADDSSSDWITTEDGKKLINHEHVQRSKLRVDTRKWAAGKLDPKRYGDRLDLKHGGKVGGPVTFVMNLSDDG